MAAYACSSSTASGSTTSGTYSTTYKSSRGSVVSYDLDLASQLPRIDLSSWPVQDEEDTKRRERAKCVLEGFCHGDGDIGALERWLWELGVGWVLGLGDGASAAGTSLLRLRATNRNITENWIRALAEITGATVRFAVERGVPKPIILVRLVTTVEETVLRMLPFVDALLAAADPLDAATDTADASNGPQAPSGRELETLLDVLDAVCSASEGIHLCFECWFSSGEMETLWRRNDDVLSLLSAKEQRLNEAIWDTMEEVTTSILNDGDDTRWSIQTPQGSSDTCKVTRSLIAYIKSLWDDYWRLNHIVRTAAELGNYVPEQDQTGSLTTLTMEMVSSLEVKLHKRSESYPDHGLRFLFLINNTHFIWQHLHPLFRMKSHLAVLTTKIEDYIQKYLQVSWEPVLSCLQNHASYYCFKTNLALPKFDSEFQKTYTAQKLWKVPDPELRTRLRKAIVEKVVSGLTRYLEDNDVTNPGVTPQEREEMLLELFEG
ncbi:unnamed protein product [Urochloa decumbens]|uniref:Exocyst subunit Exo70 family protein n=1 Tax=Urochloa decumbens TaxID=240449 RepID=A0ABC9B9J7_9POAL